MHYYRQKMSQSLGTETKAELYDQVDQEALRVGTAHVHRNTQGKFRGALPNDRLTTRSIDDHVVVRNVEIVERFEGFRYPQTFNTSEDVPQTLGNIFRNEMHNWDTREMFTHIFATLFQPAKMTKKRSKKSATS